MISDKSLSMVLGVKESDFSSDSSKISFPLRVVRVALFNENNNCFCQTSRYLLNLAYAD